MSESTIRTIQFKRGTQSALETNLVVGKLGVLLQGEPAYETDTGKLKIGDGESAYRNLPYIAGGGGQDDRFVIHDPLANEVLLYDQNLGKWVNKNLADDKSIIYLNSMGLTLKGYANAKQGQMLVKDSADGLAWVDPLNDIQLQQAVAAATAQAQQAGNYATQAANSAIDAGVSAQLAERINEQTMTWVNNKFWWGTLDEYNALEEIQEGTFYFIQV